MGPLTYVKTATYAATTYLPLKKNVRHTYRGEILQLLNPVHPARRVSRVLLEIHHARRNNRVLLKRD
jgi:hypothetical protein